MNLPLKTRIALWWGRHRKDSLFQPNLLLGKEKYPFSNFLILLPKSPESSRAARMFTQSLQNAIGPQGHIQVRYIAKRINLEYVDTAINDRLITYSDENINRWGLPEQSLLKIIFVSKPEVVIDLNLEFDPVSATIVQQSAAPMRIGFYNEENEKYFNILIDRNENEFIENGYKKIQQLLGLA
ncbi:MAG: hypothetical protein ACE5D0_05145 [Fidelibacterota bacterium]